MAKNLLIDNNTTMVFFAQHMINSQKLDKYDRVIKKIIINKFFHKPDFVFTDIDSFYKYLYYEVISVLLKNWYLEIFHNNYIKKMSLKDKNDRKQIIAIGDRLINILTEFMTAITYKKYEKDDIGKVIFFNFYDNNTNSKLFNKYEEYTRFYEYIEKDGDNFIFDYDKLYNIHQENLFDNTDKTMEHKINTFREAFDA